MKVTTTVDLEDLYADEGSIEQLVKEELVALVRKNLKNAIQKDARLMEIIRKKQSEIIKRAYQAVGD